MPEEQGGQFLATRKASRASKATDMKTKIKDIELPELSGSESSKMLNPDMEDVLQKNMSQLAKRASLVERPKDIKELVLPRKRFLFMSVTSETLIKWSQVL